MVVYQKMYFKAHTNGQYFWHKNNIAKLYFISGRAEFCYTLAIPRSQIIQVKSTVYPMFVDFSKVNKPSGRAMSE